MPNVKAFVLGNGKSRLKFDLHNLKSCGKVYGCNALFRDFTPDVLVATDKPMAAEIEKANYAGEFWTRHPSPKYNKININFGFSSGPIALSMAAQDGYRPIYLIGFDLVGEKGNINNVYAGTDNYRPTSDKETYWGNWVSQITTIMKNQYPNSKFIRCVDTHSYTPDDWLIRPNYSEIAFEDLISSINNTLCQKQKE